MEIKYSSKYEFSRVAYCLLMIASIACAVYLFAIPAKQVDAQKIDPKMQVPTENLVTVFPTSTGLPAAIPDNNVAGIDLTIPVAGITAGHVLRGVEVDMTFDQPAGIGGHTWVGDLTVTLTDPNATSHSVFTRTGRVTTGSGDSSDAQGPYTFADLRTPTPAADWWAVAVATVGGTLPADTYRTHAADSATPTLMSPVFQQIALADTLKASAKANNDSKTVGSSDNLVNGAWTLSVSDQGGGDTGRVSALSLRLITLPPTAAVAAVQGRVVTAGGQPIARARVTILNSNTVETVTVQTNQFGYFTIDDLPVGVFYTMWVESGRHTFDAPTQNFVLENDLLDAVFVSNN